MPTPTITPLSVREFEVKQSKYNVVGTLPSRSILLSPSGGGKTILIANMIMDIYKGVFERVYIFSHSINVDHTWESVKKYLAKTIKLKEDEPGLYYDEYDPKALELIIETQKEMITHQKQDKETKRLWQIDIVIDDFSDDAQFSRNSKLLHALFTRGRHSHISTIIATQQFTMLAKIIRVNASELYVCRLRNYSDVQTLLDELGGIVGDKKVLLEMYNLATKEPYSFLYCKLTAKDRNDMFYIKYKQKLVISD